MIKKNICIIGLGARGLTVLERLFYYSSKFNQELNIIIINVDSNGSGLHSTSDSEHLLLNTVAGQIMALPKSDNRKRLTFYEWLEEKNYRIDENLRVNKNGRRIIKNDYLPRWILAEYLQACFKNLISEKPENINVIHYKDEVVSIKKKNNMEEIRCLSGKTLDVDEVFLTTGHTGFMRIENGLLPPYGSSIKVNGNVGISGQGLVAIDKIMDLTLGKGGRFTREGKELEYKQSGNEPNIYLFSRSGSPFLTRPVFNSDSEYKPFVFKESNLKKIKAKKNSHQLNFEEDILPLLWIEMKIRFYLTKIKLCGTDEEYNKTIKILKSNPDKIKLYHILDELSIKYGVFEPDKELTEIHEQRKYKDADEYQSVIVNKIKDDLTEARLGILKSPKKAAFELLRDLRDIIRYSVDFKGLEPNSHKFFVNTFTPFMNKMVTGPHIERTEEILKLIELNILNINLGPLPKIRKQEGYNYIQSTSFNNNQVIKLDYVFTGYIPVVNIETSQSNLINNLFKEGRIIPFQNGDKLISGIEVNRDLHPINIKQEIESNISVLGPICEGVKFYNHYVPSTVKDSLAFKDADSIVKKAIMKYKKMKPLKQEV